MTPEQTEQLVEQGWVIMDFPEPQLLKDYAAKLEARLQELAKNPAVTLANLHTLVDEATFKTLHKELSEFVWEQEFSLAVGRAMLPVMRQLIGLDVMVQYMPYLRLARPGRADDNIGFHKDTQYGQTPYELAVHIPFVDLAAPAALKVIAGSHLQAEEDYVHKHSATTVTKGSLEHQLGKPYKPQDLRVPQGATLTPLALRVGQVAMFSPAIFHGQELNEGEVTRVTTDLRFVHTYAPVPLRKGKVRAGYVTISHSPIDRAAGRYYAAQQATSAAAS